MAPSQAVAPVLPGETLAGKYKVERILGRGGMGIVVAARHLELDERVAIKFLLRADEPAALARFLREARAAAKVKNEHVCRVYDVGRLETGEPYLVMEYLEGVDLGQRLAKEGRLPLAVVAGWMIEACAALSEAHALGIVHRDLKPANVFLATRADGTTCVKILDFGISKLPSSDAMTSTTALIGSPAYMSPEQLVSARTVDHRADVWSIGVMLHELVTGTPPFSADTVIQLTVKIREDAPRAPSNIVGTLPAAFDVVVGKCLAKAPADRHASVRELALALSPFAAPEGRHLAERIGRDRSTSAIDPALVATMRDEGSADGRATPAQPSVVPSEAAAPGVGQVTLEPLSSARATEPQRSRRWLPAGVLGLVAISALVGSRRCGGSANGVSPSSASPSSAASVVAASTEVVPSAVVAVPEVVLSSVAPNVVVTAVSPAPSVTFSAPLRRAPAPSTSVASARPENAGSAEAAAAPIATVGMLPSAQPTTTATAPALDASGRRRRTLDRSDPYER